MYKKCHYTAAGPGWESFQNAVLQTSQEINEKSWGKQSRKQLYIRVLSALGDIISLDCELYLATEEWARVTIQLVNRIKKLIGPGQKLYFS